MTPFSLGLSYRPRLTGFQWWESFDASATHEEFAQIADWGCDTLRVSLPWDLFQPSAQRINGRAMHVLEQVLDAAQTAALQVVPVLFPVAEHGVLTLPSWANGANLIDELSSGGVPTLRVHQSNGPALLIEGRYRPNQARDLFGYRPILTTQHYFIREVVGYFDSHPSVAIWQLGEGLERIRNPTSAAIASAWYATMADAIRQQRPSNKVLGVVSLYGMQRRNSPHPEEIAAACTQLGVCADPPEPPTTPQRHTTLAAFALALASGLAQRPAICTSLGMPTTGQRGGYWAEEPIHGQLRAVFYADAEQHAMFIEQALDRLYRAGAAGIWLSAYADHPESHASIPPLDRVARTRTLGLIDAQGREKPAVQALRTFASMLQTNGRAIANTTPPAIDAERHWHDPQQHTLDLWAGFDP